MVPDKYFGVVFNGIVGGIKVVLVPVSKALHFIFHPVAQAWRAMMRPMKRACHRMVAKVRGRKAENVEEEVLPVDEEAAVLPSKSPASPHTSLASDYSHSTELISRPFKHRIFSWIAMRRVLVRTLGKGAIGVLGLIDNNVWLLSLALDHGFWRSSLHWAVEMKHTPAKHFLGVHWIDRYLGIMG